MDTALEAEADDTALEAEADDTYVGQFKTHMENVSFDHNSAHQGRHLQEAMSAESSNVDVNQLFRLVEEQRLALKQQSNLNTALIGCLESLERAKMMCKR